MNGLNEKRDELDISELLQEADAENEVARALQEKREAEKARLTKTIVAPAVGTGAFSDPEKDAESRRNLDAETIELIDKYSTREVRDEKSDTQELRETLARKLQGDKLLGYLDPNAQNTAKRAEHLREAIRDAGQISADELERRMNRHIADEMSDSDPSGRFSDEEELPAQELFGQTEMFPLGDGMTLKEEQQTVTPSATFDRDYEALGEKVIGYGIPEEPTDSEQLSFFPEETDVEPLQPEMDETEINLRYAFDMMRDGDSGAEAVRREQLSGKRKRMRTEEPLLLYTAPSQNAEIDGKLKKSRRQELVRLALAAIAAVLLWRFEVAGADGMFGSLLQRGSAGVRLYILIDLQLLFLCGLAILPSLVRGVRGLLSRKLIPESMLVCGMLCTALYAAVLIVREPAADSLRLYGLTMGLAAVCAALANVQTASRNCHAFRMIASKRPKYITERLQNAVKESEAFGRYLYEDSELYTVRRTSFVEGFSERVVKRSKYNDLLHFLLPLILLSSAVLFTVLLFLGRTIDEAARAFAALVAFSLPSTVFFMIPLPLAMATRKGKKCSGAFIGSSIAEEYAMASALSFADTEVYPPNMVNVTSVKTYGEYRIDKVIPDVARVFAFLGGPLARVTERMIDGEVERPTTARVIENVADGICAAIDGKHFFLGKRSYLRRYRFEAPVDQGDEAYEKGVGSVMYVVIDDQLAAKFYIRYRINPRFEQLLQDMYRAGLCLGVKTMDPNITNELIAGAIRFHKCPVAVLKQDVPGEIAGNTARASGGVVCNSSLHNFLRMFSLCDKVRHVTKCNAIISTVSTVLSAAAVAFLAVTGNLQTFGAAQALLFQFCWQLPIWILSFLSV